MGIAIALLPALPAQASSAVKPIPDGTQVLVAQGDGWYLYAPAASVASIKVSQVQVAGRATPMTVVDCGWASCSVYLSRSQTQAAYGAINSLGGGIGGLVAACGLISLMGGPAGVIIAAACGAEVAVLGGFLLNAINNAATSNGCLRIRYGAFTAFYSDHSGFCHDN